MTKSMTRNQNHDDNDDTSSSRKRFKTCDTYGAGPTWPDLNHHVLYIVMMQLGVVDYLSFGGVCKSWRSLALSERNIFMASKPPMIIRISWRTSKKACYLEDFEGRTFTTILDSFGGGICVGLTCGYLIFFRRKTHDFWLVNPITRHQLYFTDFPIKYKNCPDYIRAILVYSNSVCGWVFVVMHIYSGKIWLYIAGKGAWNHISCTSPFTDLRAFKGIIYTLNRNRSSFLCELYELSINPEPKLTLLETKNSLNLSRISQPELVCSGENIYVMDRTREDQYRFQELDYGEMKWVTREKTVGEYASFLSSLKHGVADKSVLGESHGQGLLLGHNTGDMLKLIEVDKANSFTANMWYFPHECLNVDLIDK